LHLAVVLEKAHVVGRGLDTQDDPALVVHLDGRRAHVVANPGALDPGAQVVAHLVGEVAVQLAPEERSDVFGLDRVHGCAHQRLVDRSQVGLASEDDVGRVLDLHQTPVVSGLHCVEYGTVASGEIVEALVQSRDVEVVCERLRPLEVVDSGERIVEHGEANLSHPLIFCRRFQ